MRSPCFSGLAEDSSGQIYSLYVIRAQESGNLTGCVMPVYLIPQVKFTIDEASLYGRKITDFEVRQAGLQSLTLPLISYVTLGKSFNSF